MIKAQMIFAVFLLGSSMSFAGQKVGNGGDGVVCFQNAKDYKLVAERIEQNRLNQTYKDVLAGIDIQKFSVKSFDILSLAMGQNADEPDTTNPEVWVNKRLRILEEKTQFFDILNKSNSQFPFSKWLAETSGLREIDDENIQTNLPSQCLLIQVAIQSVPGVYFDTRLFGKMDVLNQSFLIMHEAVYRVALRNGETNSESSRALTAYLMSKQFVKDQGVDVVRKLVSLNFKEKNKDWPLYSKNINLKNNEHILVYDKDIFNEFNGMDHSCSEKGPFYKKGTTCFVWKESAVQGLVLQKDRLIYIDSNDQIVGGVVTKPVTVSGLEIPKNAMFAIANQFPLSGFVIAEGLDTENYSYYEVSLFVKSKPVQLRCLMIIQPGSLMQTDILSPESFSCALLQSVNIFGVPIQGGRTSDGGNSYLMYDFESSKFTATLEKDFDETHKAGQVVSFDENGKMF